MIVATIHRNEHDNEWIVLVRDTIRETKETHKATTVTEAEHKAAVAGASKVKVMFGTE